MAQRSPDGKEPSVGQRSAQPGWAPLRTVKARPTTSTLTG